LEDIQDNYNVTTAACKKSYNAPKLSETKIQTVPEFTFDRQEE